MPAPLLPPPPSRDGTRTPRTPKPITPSARTPVPFIDESDDELEKDLGGKGLNIPVPRPKSRISYSVSRPEKIFKYLIGYANFEAL